MAAALPPIEILAVHAAQSEKLQARVDVRIGSVELLGCLLWRDQNVTLPRSRGRKGGYWPCAKITDEALWRDVEAAVRGAVRAS